MSDITSAVVSGIQSRVVDSTAPNDKESYQWNARTSQWESHAAVYVQDDMLNLPDFTGNSLYPNMRWYGSASTASSVTNHPGVVSVASGTSGNYMAHISMLSDGVPVANAFEAVAIIETPASFPADTLMLIGFANSIGGTTFAGIRYDASQDTEWTSITGNPAGTNTANNVAAIATSTWYKIKIRFDGTNFHFSVNDGAEQTHTTNLPAVAIGWFQMYFKSATTFYTLVDYYGLTFNSVAR